MTHIRNKGAMNALISSDNQNIDQLKAILAKVPSMEGQELSSKVATKVAYEVKNEGAKYKVALVDLGVKQNIIRCLVDRGCHVKVFPMDSSIAELNDFQPDGYMLSNGPGDPGVMRAQINLVKEIAEQNKPVFGICL